MSSRINYQVGERVEVNIGMTESPEWVTGSIEALPTAENDNKFKVGYVPPNGTYMRRDFLISKVRKPA